LDVELRRASSLAQSGRFAEAVQLYREILARTPGDLDATHFLGVCLAQSGRRDEGLQLIERSVSLAPQNAMYRQNFGLMLAEAGQLAAAESQFKEILHQDGNATDSNATAHNYLGMVRQRMGRFDDAIASYKEALRLKPGDAAAANNLGYCLLERGDVEGATEWLSRSLAADSRNPMAHSNLGNALRTRGDLQGAQASYRRAIALAPDFANAHYNLALTLRDLGEHQEGFQSARAAVHCAPEHAAAWQLFAELLAGMRFSAWDAELAADCERLFRQTEAEVQDCAEAVLSLVRTGPRGRLFLLLLEHALVADEAFEQEMTALRRELLTSPISLELVCAIGQQCFLNEYVWAELEEEAAVVAELPAQTALQVGVLSMYRPLKGIDKPEGGGETFERLWRRLVKEPAEEAALEVGVLTTVEDAVSRKVQAQYEANPYPRWHRAPAAGAFPLPRMLRALFPHLEPAKLAAPEAPQILIAGCGTGRHAAISAQLQPLGRVLAVDISRASLAYATRRCRELGLQNIRFAQADILELGRIGERFDLIECSGVLHHMKEPMTGWRVLLSLLKPGGFMKLGLYSESARKSVVSARAVVDGLEVRKARERIFVLPAAHPARKVTALRDFYSASGVRDLILHVQEHRFSIPGLRTCIDALGAEFLGFELPGKRLAMSLEEWHAYEAANPDTFASMYQFWIRRA
jgi:Flp pilus assembly protein TadD/SAM-dependent methyltransferase